MAGGLQAGRGGESGGCPEQVRAVGLSFRESSKDPQSPGCSLRDLQGRSTEARKERVWLGSGPNLPLPDPGFLEETTYRL